MTRIGSILRGAVIVVCSQCLIANADPNWNALPYTSHSAFQAVDADGAGTFPLDNPVKMRGIIINRADQMLNPTPDLPSFFGGQWQQFIQAVDTGDFGGTALFMAQRYSDLPFEPPDDHYSAAQWLAELNRIEHDPATGHTFHPGDLIEVRARAPGLFFEGKTNINEQHNVDPAVNFDVVLLAADCGIPLPTVFTLSDVKDASDHFIFDQTRATGAEHLQGAYLRLNHVTFQSTTNWGPDAFLTAQDGTGRTLVVHLGLGTGFTSFPAPTGAVDLIGILDQESPDPGPYTGDYQLWIMDYNGNGHVVPQEPSLPGDLNGDGAVNGADIAPFLTALLNRDAFETLYPAGNAQAGNLDGQCGITLLDVPPFVVLLLNQH